MDNLLSLDIIQYYPIVSRQFGLTMIDIYGIYRSPISVGGVLQKISQAIGGTTQLPAKSCKGLDPLKGVLTTGAVMVTESPQQQYPDREIPSFHMVIDKT